MNLRGQGCVVFDLLSLHTGIHKAKKGIVRNVFLLCVERYECLVTLNPSLTFCFSSFYPSGCSIPGGHHGERRLTGHHTTQTRRNPKNVSEDGRVGEVRTSLNPLLWHCLPLLHYVGALLCGH